MQSSSFSSFFSQRSRWSVCTADTESAASAGRRAHRSDTAVACALAALLTTGVVAPAASANGTVTPIPIATGTPQQADPIVKSVRSTPRGYVVIGHGFGRDPAKVTVYENGSPVPEDSIVGVSNTRISVFSIPQGPIGITVEARGFKTESKAFTHVEPPAQEEFATDIAASASSLRSVSGASVATAAKTIQPSGDSRNDAETDGYLAREVLRLRDRLSSLEQEISMLRQQMGISSR